MVWTLLTFDIDVRGYSPENPTYYVGHSQCLVHNLRDTNHTSLLFFSFLKNKHKIVDR